MYTEPRHPDGRSTTANYEFSHQPRARIPGSRRITLPHTRMQVSIHPDGRAHPGGISRASGTTSRRALDVPSRRRIRI